MAGDDETTTAEERARELLARDALLTELRGEVRSPGRLSFLLSLVGGGALGVGLVVFGGRDVAVVSLCVWAFFVGVLASAALSGAASNGRRLDALVKLLERSGALPGAGERVR